MDDVSKIFVALIVLAIIAVVVSSGQPAQVIGDLGQLLASFVNRIFAAGQSASAAATALPNDAGAAIGSVDMNSWLDQQLLGQAGSIPVSGLTGGGTGLVGGTGGTGNANTPGVITLPTFNITG